MSKKVLTEILSQSNKSQSYKSFYEKVAQHLEQRGYDYVENDVRNLYMSNPREAVDHVKAMITKKHLIDHPMLTRAIHTIS